MTLPSSERVTWGGPHGGGLASPFLHHTFCISVLGLEQVTSHQLASKLSLFCLSVSELIDLKPRCWRAALPGAAVPPRGWTGRFSGRGHGTTVISAGTCKTLPSVYSSPSRHEEDSWDVGPAPWGHWPRPRSSLRCHHVPRPSVCQM